jgi:hypothetical protein
MVHATDRSGGRLGRVVRPTLSQRTQACKREQVVAPQLAARAQPMSRPGPMILTAADPAAAADMRVMVGRGRHVLR